MIAYEIVLSVTVIPVICCANSLNLYKIIRVQQESIPFCVPLVFGFIIFFVAMLAETNRAPFDLPEAEAELVAGFNVEYSSITFALFFLGEYSAMILMSFLCVILYFGG
jgi:NADH-quinone oxidoreductase subunit H